MSRSKLIGLYGGAFDPVHNAHIQIANNCINEIGLDKLVLLPTGRSAFNKPLTPAIHRLAMLNLAFKGSSFEISNLEIEDAKNSVGSSYTIDTMKYFFSRDINTYFFIIGTDALASINKWRNWNEILNYCHLLVINRFDDDIYSHQWHPEIRKLIDINSTTQKKILRANRNGFIYNISMPKIDIASNLIKNSIQKKLNIDLMIPNAVKRYIYEHGLY